MNLKVAYAMAIITLRSCILNHKQIFSMFKKALA